MIYEIIGYHTDHYSRQDTRLVYSDIRRVKEWARSFLAMCGRKVVLYRRERRRLPWCGGKRKKIAEWRNPAEVWP